MRVNPLNKAFDEHGQPSPGVEKFLNHALRVQRPWVVKMIKHMRRQHPDETPAQLAKRARKLYVRSVTAGGGAVGAGSIQVATASPSSTWARSTSGSIRRAAGRALSDTMTSAYT